MNIKCRKDTQFIDSKGRMVVFRDERRGTSVAISPQA